MTPWLKSLVPKTQFYRIKVSIGDTGFQMILNAFVQPSSELLHGEKLFVTKCSKFL